MKLIVMLLAVCACVISCHTQPVQESEEVSCVFCSDVQSSTECELASPWH